MKQSFTIAKKIWFSLSILVLGYLFSTVVGYVLGSKTELSLLKVSEQRFPVAQKSEAALGKFKKQINLYSEAVLTGESERIDLANAQENEVRRLLLEIANLSANDPLVHEHVKQTLKLLDRFNSSADGVYRSLSSTSGGTEAKDSLSGEAKELAWLTDMIIRRLSQGADESSNQLKVDLAHLRQISRQQRSANIIIFACVVICSVMLIAVIIARSIMAPLQRTFMLEKVVEQFADGIAVTDLKGQIEFVNRSWAKMHGYEMDELIGEQITLFHTPKQNEHEFQPLFGRACREGFSEGEVGHEHKDGRIFQTFMSICQIRNEQEGLLGIINSAKDITLQKRSEEELRQAKNEAEIANASKSIFLANMSHEIRTPLNGVMGALNLLLSMDLDHDQLELVQTGKSSADHLLAVISDILDFSKIEAGKLDMEILDFDLHYTLEEVVELPGIQAQAKGLEFAYLIEPNVPRLLKGDPGRLRQIILNLTNNAIKFTTKGEVFMRISLETETECEAKIKFEVIDTGIGIAENKRDRLFKAFQQTDSSTTRKYGGTGLGLSISKKLVGMMNGEVGLRSTPGKGSTFWFTALFQRQSRKESLTSAKPASIAGKRLLIVDDNKTNLDILGKYLTVWGCAFDIAHSGEMALSILNAVAKVKAPFDAMIIDMLMPGMDGAELGERIKKDPCLKATKMIMLTSLGMRGEASLMKEIGFSAYLTKPIRMSQLFSSLEAVLNERPAAREAKAAALVTKHSLSEQQRQKTRILVAEDNSINLKLILRLIEKFGFKADAAANGKEVLKMLEAFHFDLVLMDQQMPEMDGLEATRRIRDARSKVFDHNIPVIALTANAMKGDREICIEAGMNDYVTKPINPQELLEAIERNIQHSRHFNYE